MERKHTGKIIGLLVLLFVSSYGSNVETLLQANIDYDKAGGYAFLYSLLGLCGSALIAITIPLVCRLIKGKKLSHKWGRLLCVINSIVAVVISAILQEMFDILFVGGIGAIIYYFINKWLFVAGKEGQTEKNPSIKAYTNDTQKMHSSFPDEKTIQYDNYAIQSEEVRLDHNVTPIRVTETTPTNHPSTVTKPPLSDQKNNLKYCSSCGSVIDSNTKKCTGCGKQYFKRISAKMVCTILLGLLLVASLAGNIILYLNFADVKSEAALVSGLQERINNLQKEVDDLEEDANLYYDFWEDNYKKVELLDSWIVFVENDGSGLYHKYECHKFVGNDCWAHNVEYAEYIGYKPCPLCCD